METVGILWAGVVVIVAVGVMQNLRGAAEVRDEWRAWCRRDDEEQARKRAEGEHRAAARAAERAAFYAGHHGIKPDGWPGPVAVDRREHEKLSDWRG